MATEQKNTHAEDEPLQLPVILVSDLHLEFFAEATAAAVVPQYLDHVVLGHAPGTKRSLAASRELPHIAVVAGDLGNPRFRPQSFHAALAWFSNTFEHVVYVPGNHEYYSLEPAPVATAAGHEAQGQGTKHVPLAKGEIDVNLRQAAADYTNVHLLRNGATWSYAGFTFIGATLWSRTKDYSLYAVADYRYIHACSADGLLSRITPATTLSWHERELAQVTAALARVQKEQGSCDRAVVVSHHLPSFKMIAERFAGDDTTAAFASNCEPILREFEPAAWLCGHSHVHMQRVIHGVPVFLHAVGYYDEVAARMAAAAAKTNDRGKTGSMAPGHVQYDVVLEDRVLARLPWGFYDLATYLTRPQLLCIKQQIEDLMCAEIAACAFCGTPLGDCGAGSLQAVLLCKGRALVFVKDSCPDIIEMRDEDAYRNVLQLGAQPLCWRCVVTRLRDSTKAALPTEIQALLTKHAYE